MQTNKEAASPFPQHKQNLSPPILGDCMSAAVATQAEQESLAEIQDLLERPDISTNEYGV
jgi:hypothetical protein